MRLTIKILIILSILYVFSSNAAFGAIIYVHIDQPTIQAGIDAASEGDIVVVADGIYTGDGNKDLDFGGKAIEVRSPFITTLGHQAKSVLCIIIN